jgi:hypothetical protein
MSVPIGLLNAAGRFGMATLTDRIPKLLGIEETITDVGAEGGVAWTETSRGFAAVPPEGGGGAGGGFDGTETWRKAALS